MTALRERSYTDLILKSALIGVLMSIKTANPEFGSQCVMTHDMVRRDARVTVT